MSEVAKINGFDVKDKTSRAGLELVNARVDQTNLAMESVVENNSQTNVAIQKVESDLADLQTSVTNTNSRIDVTNTSVEQVNTKAEANKTSIQTTNIRIDTTNTTVATLSERLDGFQEVVENSDSTKLSAKVIEVENNVNGVVRDMGGYSFFTNPTIIGLVLDNSPYKNESGLYVIADSPTGLALLENTETYTSITVEGNFYRNAGADTVNPFKSGGTIDLLWSNPTPTTVFPAQTIELDLTEYDGVLIQCNYTAGTNGFQIPEPNTYSFIAKGTRGKLVGVYSAQLENNVVTNRIASVDDSGVIFAGGYSTTGSVNDSSCTPCYIWGVKAKFSE